MSPYVVLGSSLAPMALTSGGSEYDSVSFTGLINALNIAPSDVLGVLASGVGICLALCFAWWGARKLAGMFMRSFKRGKLRL